MNLGFAGTPGFAVHILQALIDSDHAIDAVFTQPDRPAGRGRKLVPSPVRTLAEAAGLAVHTPLRIADALAWLKDLDVLVVAAYGLLLPQPALDAPKRGCINVHASLLPRWRGAAPVERAIMAGDTSTGVSIMQMDAGLDTGPVLLSRSIAIKPADTGMSLTASLAQLGADAVLQALARLETLAPVAQDDALATFAPKIVAADAAIDWRNDAERIARRVRALAHRRTAYATMGKDRLRVLQARAVLLQERATDLVQFPGTTLKTSDGILVVCGEGALLLETVQLSRGRGRPMSALDAANGYPNILAAGARFDVPG